MEWIRKLVIVNLIVIISLNISVGTTTSHVNDHEIKITKLGQITTTGRSYRMHVEDDLAFVADSVEGLKIIDITNPSNPELIGQYLDGGFPFDLHIEGNLVYFADHGGGLKIVDFTDPTNPTLIGQFTDEDWSRDVQVIGDLAYVADWEDGIEILNISDPTQPFKISDIGSEVFSLFVTVNLVFAAGEILKIYDVSDPFNPIEVGVYDTGNASNEIYVDGNLAYVAAWNKGFVILDVGDPANITLLGQYIEEGIGSDGVYIKNEVALVADYTNGVLALNISNFANITKIGHFHDGGEAYMVEMIGNLVYVADGTDGFEILQIGGLFESSTTYITSTTMTTTTESVSTSETKDSPGFELHLIFFGFTFFLLIKKNRGKKSSKYDGC
ncbi:MAG: LVIVD repeat-containing protein [Candidatus Hodarchaeota archaeon]